MIAAGVFHPEARLELIDGDIINMTPQGSLHVTAVRLTEERLRLAFPKGYDIRVQMPLALDANSEPEPDIAVVTGNLLDYRDAHPNTAALIVEVADTTLPFDRHQKKRLYARNGIKDYWILNLIDQQLEVYRNPEEDDYKQILTLRSEESVAPLAAPESNIAIEDLLP
jgi:Uma2 family endonuclease